MNSKIPLYLSAITLFLLVLASLFFFNVIQKLKKSIKEARVDKNAFVNLSGKVDMLYSDLQNIAHKIKNEIQKPEVIKQDDEVGNEVGNEVSNEVDEEKEIEEIEFENEVPESSKEDSEVEIEEIEL